MQLTLTPEETQLLVDQLARRLQHIDDELVHTDKHELQHELAREVDAVRALLARIRSEARLS